VRLLEQCVSEGTIPDWLPRLRNITDVQRWTDKERELKAWSSPNVTSPAGTNSDIRARLNEILPKFLALVDGTRAGKTTEKRPRRGKPISIRQTENERDRLAAQNEELLAENQSQADEITRLRDSLDLAHRELRQLIAKHNLLVPFDRLERPQE
jgi:hypothetical protein